MTFLTVAVGIVRRGSIARMCSTRLTGLFGWRRARVIGALDLLRDAAPEHFAHFVEHIDEIRLRRGGCEGALACTGASHGAVAVLDELNFDDVVEVAVILSHESRHHFTDEFGIRYIAPHAVDVGMAPWYAQFDPIYIEDARLRRHLRVFLAGVRRRRHVRSMARANGFAAAAAFGVGAPVGAAVLRGLSRRTARTRNW